MLTPNDSSSHGKSEPEKFRGAERSIFNFCHHLRSKRHRARALREIEKLPQFTGSEYSVEIFKPGIFFENGSRSTYFREFRSPPDSLTFIDPDNGLEPPKSCSVKHVRYCEVDLLLERALPDSALAVFQHARRIAFPEDFAGIRRDLYQGHAAAIYWHSLMFVVISRSKDTLTSVRAINQQYSASRKGVSPLP